MLEFCGINNAVGWWRAKHKDLAQQQWLFINLMKTATYGIKKIKQLLFLLSEKAEKRALWSKISRIKTSSVCDIIVTLFPLTLRTDSVILSPISVGQKGFSWDKIRRYPAGRYFFRSGNFTQICSFKCSSKNRQFRQLQKTKTNSKFRQRPTKLKNKTLWKSSFYRRSLCSRHFWPRRRSILPTATSLFWGSAGTILPPVMERLSSLINSRPTELERVDLELR